MKKMPKERKSIRLQKRLAYKYKGRKYFKHVLTVPEHIVNELGWLEGLELTPAVRKGKLLFEVSSQKQEDDLWRHNRLPIFAAFLSRAHKWLGGDEVMGTASNER